MYHFHSLWGCSKKSLSVTPPSLHPVSSSCSLRRHQQPKDHPPARLCYARVKAHSNGTSLLNDGTLSVFSPFSLLAIPQLTFLSPNRSHRNLDWTASRVSTVTVPKEGNVNDIEAISWQFRPFRCFNIRGVQPRKKKGAKRSPRGIVCLLSCFLYVLV